MKKVLWLCILIIPGSQLSAQDELGIAGSTRAPVNTVYFNPASIADSRTFIDVELSGVNVPVPPVQVAVV